MENRSRLAKVAQRVVTFKHLTKPAAIYRLWERKQAILSHLFVTKVEAIILIQCKQWWQLTKIKDQHLQLKLYDKDVYLFNLK